MSTPPTPPSPSGFATLADEIRAFREGKTDRIRWGDRIHRVATPVARRIDRTLGTDIEHCGGCREARRALNGGGALNGDDPHQVV
ncbi:MAG: hypothetical protein LBK99_09395 [Opitutaceae bacterium]|jgi:hypothetical protein|nr:hypothetical protein [Opitutaceae bacterium]